MFPPDILREKRRQPSGCEVLTFFFLFPLPLTLRFAEPGLGEHQFRIIHVNARNAFASVPVFFRAEAVRATVIFVM